MATITDLEQRGLLQYDRRVDRYDLHPVVRAVAAGYLEREDREVLGQRVVDYFSTRPHTPYDKAESLDDLYAGLTLVRTMQNMERMDEAARIYRGGLLVALLFNLEEHAEVLALLRPYFGRDWTLLPNVLDDRTDSYIASCVGIALRRLGELDAALAVFGAAQYPILRQRTWFTLRTNLSNLASTLAEQNRLARSDRCVMLNLHLAELINHEEVLFRARLDMFQLAVRAGRYTEARQIWDALDYEWRNWPRAVYRPGDAEAEFANFRFKCGALTEQDLRSAEQLARASRNRFALRRLYRLRGHWLLLRHEWAGAAEKLGEAVRLSRAAGLADPEAETRLVLARLYLGELPNPRLEAEQVGGHQRPANLALAELWQAIGDSDRATIYALAAHR